MHLAVALGEGEDGVVAGACFARRLAAGEDEAGGHALEVPLEGTADGLVEVVDVEDEAAVGRGEGAEVAHVRVAAELGDDAGVGQGERSEAMTGTAPRKKPKGDAGMRWYLRVTSAGRGRAWSLQELEGSAAAALGFPL